MTVGAPYRLEIACGSSFHTVELGDRGVRVLDHAVHEEELLVALGGVQVPCLDVAACWNNFTADPRDERLLLALLAPEELSADAIAELERKYEARSEGAFCWRPPPPNIVEVDVALGIRREPQMRLDESALLAHGHAAWRVLKMPRAMQRLRAYMFLSDLRQRWDDPGWRAYRTGAQFILHRLASRAVERDGESGCEVSWRLAGPGDPTTVATRGDRLIASVSIDWVLDTALSNAGAISYSVPNPIPENLRSKR